MNVNKNAQTFTLHKNRSSVEASEKCSLATTLGSSSNKMESGYGNCNNNIHDDDNDDDDRMIHRILLLENAQDTLLNEKLALQEQVSKLEAAVHALLLNTNTNTNTNTNNINTKHNEDDDEQRFLISPLEPPRISSKSSSSQHSSCYSTDDEEESYSNAVKPSRQFRMNHNNNNKRARRRRRRQRRFTTSTNDDNNHNNHNNDDAGGGDIQRLRSRSVSSEFFRRATTSTTTTTLPKKRVMVADDDSEQPTEDLFLQVMANEWIGRSQQQQANAANAGSQNNYNNSNNNSSSNNNNNHSKQQRVGMLLESQIIQEEGDNKEATRTNHNNDSNSGNNNHNQVRKPLYYKARRYTNWLWGGGNDDPNNMDVYETLPEDSFTFFMTAANWSIANLTALGVFCIQMATYSLLLTNAMDTSVSENNPFQIPANVKVSVRVTQLVAITITVLTQDDIRTGWSQFHKGYHKQVFQDAGFDHATWFKWFCSAIARCLEGGLGIVVTFVLIITAETVIELLLNFTAMEFVSQLDDVCFALAQQGFLGVRNQQQAEEVTERKIKFKHSRLDYIPSLFLLLLIMVGMLTGWVVVSVKQTSGEYLCDTIMVQFGDDFDRNLGYFSGLYDRSGGRTEFFAGKRVTYIGRDYPNAKFGYCQDSKTWTFTYNGTNYDDHDDDDEDPIDPCNWVVKSEKTSTYDLVKLASATWYVRNEEETVVKLSPFHLSCYDCYSDASKNKDQCSGRGVCQQETALCECTDGWYGPRCEFAPPCPQAEFFITGQFGSEYSGKFKLLKDSDGSLVEAYHRPIYYHQTFMGHFDLILFTGRRWVGTETLQLGNNNNKTSLPRNATLEQLAEYMQKSFHAYSAYKDVAFVSQPMDTLTYTDAATPFDLKWYHGQHAQQQNQAGDISSGIILTGALQCTFCDEHNPCRYDGICNLESGECECKDDTSGPLCQDTPTNNGVCNPTFNAPEFRFDGGDCCEATCESTPQISCGKDETGYIDVGYSQCRIVDSEKWMQKGFRFQNTQFADPPYGIAISANGEVLAVGEPKLDRVRVFDKDGSSWIPRGRDILGPVGTGFGSKVKLAQFQNDPHQVNNPTTIMNLRLLIHAIPTAATATAAATESVEHDQTVYLYECHSTYCVDTTYKSVIPSSKPFMADISRNGDTVAMVSNGSSDTENSEEIVIQDLDCQNDVEFDCVSRIQLNDYHSVNSVALSGLGSVLAISLLDQGSVDDQTTNPSSVYAFSRSVKVYTLSTWNGEYKDNRKLLQGGYNWTERVGEIRSDTIHASRDDVSALKLKGNALSISFDGDSIAVGNPFSKQQPAIYGYEFPTSTWELRGQLKDIHPPPFPPNIRANNKSILSNHGSPNEFVDSKVEDHSFGFNVFLSDNGKFLFVSGQDEDGQIKAYTLDDGELLSFGNSIFTGHPFASSGDGSALAFFGSWDQNNDNVALHVNKKEILSFQQLVKCPEQYSPFRFSLFLENLNVTSRGNSNTEESRMFVFSSSDNSGHVSMQTLFEYFRAQPKATIRKDVCLPTEQCLHFLFRKGNVQRPLPSPPGNFTILKNGQVVATKRPSATNEFLSIGNCLQCQPGSRLASVFMESSHPFDWLIHDSSNGAVLQNSTVLETPNPSWREQHFRNNKWYLAWKDICISTSTGCIEVFMRVKENISIPIITPTVWIGNESIMLNSVENDLISGDIYSYEGCPDKSTLALENYFGS